MKANEPSPLSPRTDVVDEDGVLTPHGMDVAHEYAQSYLTGYRRVDLEEAHAALQDFFYDLRNDRQLLNEHADVETQGGPFQKGESANPVAEYLDEAISRTVFNDPLPQTTFKGLDPLIKFTSADPHEDHLHTPAPVFIGPKGGKYKDAQHEHSWTPPEPSSVGHPAITPLRRLAWMHTVIQHHADTGGSPKEAYAQIASHFGTADAAMKERASKAQSFAQLREALSIIQKSLMKALLVMKQNGASADTLHKAALFALGDEVEPFQKGEDATAFQKVDGNPQESAPILVLEKAHPLYIGPRGGRWADAQHTIPYDSNEAKEHWGKKEDENIKRKGKPEYPEKQKEMFSSHLPEGLSHYFKGGGDVVPMSKIKAIRARPEGIENAAKHMRMAYEGKGAKRDPIHLVKLDDGTYSVVDGNSTFAQAQKNNWEHIAAFVDEDLARSVIALKESIQKGEHQGTIEQHLTEAEHLVKEHKNVEKREMDKLASYAPQGAEIQSRVKDISGVVGKLTRSDQRVNGKPKFTNVSQIHDVSGLRVITRTVQDLESTLAAFKKDHPGAKIDDRVQNPQKPMGYRSIHIIYNDEDGYTHELQIRTAGMHLMSEWTHPIYDAIQKGKGASTSVEVAKRHEQDIYKYATQANDHLFSKEKGERPPEPPAPPCPSFLRESNFGCPEL